MRMGANSIWFSFSALSTTSYVELIPDFYFRHCYLVVQYACACECIVVLLYQNGCLNSHHSWMLQNMASYFCFI